MAQLSSRSNHSSNTLTRGGTGRHSPSSEVRAQLRKLAAAKNDLKTELEAVRSFQWANKHLIVDSRNFYPTLFRALLASMDITRADFGNLQLLDESKGTLKIVVQNGFGPRFLDFFNSVHPGQATCGTAMKKLQSIFVKDVTASPIFRDNETVEVMLDAESRSVRSFPLITKSGRLVGVMSSLYRASTACTGEQIFVAETLAKHVANFIERSEIPNDALASLATVQPSQV